jgi:hypothetical protein
VKSAAQDRAHDIVSERDPLDWYIEVCGVCGCQLGPGIGTRTRTGRCIYESHRSTGGIVVRVSAKPLSEQQRPYPVLARLGVPDA